MTESNGPGSTLRVLLLEDNLDDVELELHEMRKEYSTVDYTVARNRKEFMESIGLFAPDIILADYSLPDITGIEAIKVAQDAGVEVPVILITGEGNESIAVDSLRLGAIDFILKKNISALPARVKRALEIWSDRKAKKRAESEELRLQQLLHENRKMEAIGRLAGGIAHDFNNILTGIMGFTEICLNDIPRDAAIRNKLESVISLSQKGANLIKQLLIFSKKMVMDFRSTDINSFITETVHFFKRIVEESVEIKLELHNDIPQVMCDTNQFTQVLMNLVLNAKDAMQGKGTITIKTGTCTRPDPREKKTRRHVCITVSDTGTGIDEHDISKIFDPFFTTKELGKGTGLGLSIVYSVVHAHGGTVTVESKRGEGTTFIVSLPEPDEKAVEDDSPFYEKLPVLQSAKISGTETVLVAEDEDVLRDLLSTFMRSLGYTVVTARDGMEAFSLFEREPGRYQLVISDMLMPNKNGIELFQEIRAVQPQAKFVLVTGYSLADVEEKVLEQMTAILRKPYTPIQIVKLVRDIMDTQVS